ncbi:hypothetical protein IE4771_PB00064 (plasmid) [Rhizobium etli bv. mimosae str. IE4771]|uniref:Uncharacterized protein n=1 Tax=Rhizobium etli bv. mimosae str. IE4771 TaxID=1432050 RepID=A0A060I7S1_RHIET|nr:hypothetical protein IE4771_PB00064 [Rhizobium sp. IE4771]
MRSDLRRMVSETNETPLPNQPPRVNDAQITRSASLIHNPTLGCFELPFERLLLFV